MRTLTAANGDSGTALRRLTVLVSAIVFVDTMFYAAISPLLPYYQHHFHVVKSSAGLLTAAYAAGTLIGAVPSGWLAERIGARATIVAGLSLMTAASAAFGLGHGIGILDAARFVQGVGGAASWAAGLAWLIDRASASRRGEVIGTTLAAAIIGALFGPVLGTAAAETSPAVVFLLVAALGVALALWTLSERAPSPRGGQGLGALAPALGDRGVLAGMWLTGLGALLYGTLAVLAPLRLSHLGASNVVVGAAFLFGAALAAAASPLVGRVSDRRGWRLPVVVGLCTSAVWAGVLPLPDTVWLAFALVVTADGWFGLSYPPAGAMISDGAERAGLGQAYGFALFNLAWAGGQMLGGAGGASLAQATADAVPYSALAALCILTAVALRGHRPRRGMAGRRAEIDGR